MSNPLPKPPRRGPKARKPLPRKSARPKRKKPSQKARKARQSDVRHADRLASFLCEMLAPEPNLGSQTHHLIGRANKAVRWDLDNLAWVGPELHEEVQHGPNHREANNVLAVSRLGLDRWERLKARAVTDRPERPHEAVLRLSFRICELGLAGQAKERGLL